MKDICDKLDQILLGLFPNDGINFAGFCQPIIKGDQTHPVTIEDDKQISIDNKWDALVFHRLNGQGQFSEDEENAFGRSTGRTFSQPMRTIIAYKKEKGKEWIYTFLQSWPESIDITNPNGDFIYDFIDFNDLGLDTDQVGIYNEEFGDNNYEKHRIPWNIYALEYNVEFIRC